MQQKIIPQEINNWISGEDKPATDGTWFDKVNPHNGETLCRVARSKAADVQAAVENARQAQAAWADTPAVKRGMVLHEIVSRMQAQKEDIARVVAAETGKSYKDALGETGGAIACGLFWASECQRLYGRTLTSGTANKHAMTIRQPVGVAGLIIAANTPIANVAWKVFPALACGNAAILKAAEDTPATAWVVGQISKQAGLPDGVFNIIQGYGEEAGAPLVEDEAVGVISFTGSSAVGREIAEKAGKRLAKVSLELGGKNPLVVCDDADLENAVRWVLLSAFSNAGQRCSAASRIIIFDAIYDRFRDMLLEATAKLKVGPSDEDDLGPVINQKQLDNMLAAVERAGRRGSTVLSGGSRMTDAQHAAGFYMTPTLIEGAAPQDEISTTELFGPITCLYRVKDFDEALALANESLYGLTACIHTRSLNRAVQFTQKVQAGVAVVNAATYGSEPHMPFGGFKQSGNGSREPGSEAIDVYSETKGVYFNVDADEV